MIRLAVFAAVLALMSADAVAGETKYTWDLKELYPTEAAWAQAKDGAVAEFPVTERHDILGWRVTTDLIWRPMGWNAIF